MDKINKMEKKKEYVCSKCGFKHTDRKKYNAHYVSVKHKMSAYAFAD